MQNYIIYAIWAFTAGAVIPVMAVFNGQLSRAIDSPYSAAALLLLIGFSASLVFLFITRTSLPSMANLTSVPPHIFLGGMIVAFYIFSVTILAPRFGVGNTILFIVSAQICVSAAIDNWGLFGAPIRPINFMRLGGLVILCIGLIIAQLGAITGKQNP